MLHLTAVDHDTTPLHVSVALRVLATRSQLPQPVDAHWLLPSPHCHYTHLAGLLYACLCQSASCAKLLFSVQRCTAEQCPGQWCWHPCSSCSPVYGGGQTLGHSNGMSPSYLTLNAHPHSSCTQPDYCSANVTRQRVSPPGKSSDTMAVVCGASLSSLCRYGHAVCMFLTPTVASGPPTDNNLMCRTDA